MYPVPKVKKICTLLVLPMVILFPSCKTAEKKSRINSGEGQITGGVFNDQGVVNIKVPTDINGFTPPSGLSTDSVSSPQVEGLTLTGNKPISSKGIEEIEVKCFTKDSLFVADNWYFYAELRSGGRAIKDYASKEVDKCNEMQLDLKTLDKTQTYEVEASFFWQSKDRKVTIVWYEGKTKPFKPSDVNISLVLEKLRVNQTVDVDVEKSEKDQCIYQKYLWNGKRCLDGYNSLVFAHADLTDYAQAADIAGSRNRKCMQIGDGGLAVQYDCNYKAHQRIMTRLHGQQKLIKDLPPKEYGWFTMQFDAGKMCLQVQIDPAGKDPYLVQAPCDEEVPRSDQLFTLVETLVGDAGARNSFRIMNQADGTPRCVSIPPEKGDKTGVAPLRNNAPVRLTPCSTKDPNARTSQFIRFVDVTD